MTGGGGGMHDGEQDEGILNAFERRLINILGEEDYCRMGEGGGEELDAQ